MTPPSITSANFVSREIAVKARVSVRTSKAEGRHAHCRRRLRCSESSDAGAQTLSAHCCGLIDAPLKLDSGCRYSKTRLLQGDVRVELLCTPPLCHPSHEHDAALHGHVRVDASLMNAPGNGCLEEPLCAASTQQPQPPMSSQGQTHKRTFEARAFVRPAKPGESPCHSNSSYRQHKPVLISEMETTPS